MKILLLDLENSAINADVWGLFDQTIPLVMMREPGRVICFAYQWYDEGKTRFVSEYHNGHEGMVKKAWELLDQADIVIHYNGNRHDMPWLKTEFYRSRLGPPSPYKNVDLYTVVKQFKFPSNKLDHVLTESGLTNKVKHSGYTLWIRCLAGEAKAWSEMKKYNMGDVDPLRALYDMLRPWIKGHPNVTGYTGVIDACPTCGSPERQKRGYAFSPTGFKYQQYRCKNCNAWYRDSKSIETTSTRRAA